MKLNPNERRSVAYFSMEIGIDERMCAYSGGLGVLAGERYGTNVFLRPIPLSRQDTTSFLSILRGR